MDRNFPCLSCAVWLFLLASGSASAIGEDGLTQTIKGRALLSKPTEFDEELLCLWGVPGKAELLIQSQTSCGDPPPSTAGPNLALLCNLFNKTRECMGIGPKDAWISGSGCTGQECLLTVGTLGSKCLLNGYGVDLDIANESRRESCGLGPEDLDWLNPIPNVHQEPVGGIDNCVSGIPSNINLHYFAVCERGEPLLRFQLALERNITEGEFGCVLAPICYEGLVFESNLVCFAERPGGTGPSRCEASGVGKGRELTCDSSLHLGVLMLILAGWFSLVAELL